MLTNESFTHVISGSRDKKIMMTELRNPSNSILVCEESAPVLSLCFDVDQCGIWVNTKFINTTKKNLSSCFTILSKATTWASGIRSWKLPQSDQVPQCGTCSNKGWLFLRFVKVLGRLVVPKRFFRSESLIIFHFNSFSSSALLPLRSLMNRDTFLLPP